MVAFSRLPSLHLSPPGVSGLLLTCCVVLAEQEQADGAQAEAGKQHSQEQASGVRVRLWTAAAGRGLRGAERMGGGLVKNGYYVKCGQKLEIIEQYRATLQKIEAKNATLFSAAKACSFPQTMRSGVFVPLLKRGQS